MITKLGIIILSLICIYVYFIYGMHVYIYIYNTLVSTPYFCFGEEGKGFMLGLFSLKKVYSTLALGFWGSFCFTQPQGRRERTYPMFQNFTDYAVNRMKKFKAILNAAEGRREVGIHLGIQLIANLALLGFALLGPECRVWSGDCKTPYGRALSHIRSTIANMGIKVYLKSDRIRIPMQYMVYSFIKSFVGP